MPLFVAILFWVLLAAGIYLERMSWLGALGLAIPWLLVVFVFWDQGWEPIGWLYVNVPGDAILLPYVFGRDLWVPPWSGN